LLSLFLFLLPTALFASAYDGRPKLVVVVVVDQLRADQLERFRHQFAENGFRLFLDRGAVFTNCNYEYTNTRTGPGHATLLSGAYPPGHGIGGNEWWDADKKRIAYAAQDPAMQLVGAEGGGLSPHYLLASTLGDELKLATSGRSRAFAVSLKGPAAVLAGGRTADAAYWIEHKNGAWITSSYYMQALPAWVQQFNQGRRAEKYWNREWKDSAGKTWRTTSVQDGSRTRFFDIVGATPFATDYQLEFVRELITQEKLGSGPATDLLIVSLSATDILGHEVGPDSPQAAAMLLALDRQLAEFFGFLARQLGLANVWLVLSSDHGIAPLPAYAAKLRLPAAHFDPAEMRKRVNSALNAKLSPGRNLEYVTAIFWPYAYLSPDAFAAVNMKQAEAERAAGEALDKEEHVRGFLTRTQLAQGQVPADQLGRRYANSYTPYGGWYVLLMPAAWAVAHRTLTDHATPYSYDTHVPVALYGLPFQPGTYRGRCETVDLAVTLASLLGINTPSHAVGRVLTETVVTPREPR
jgi:arylsulfatase A-like enzyme